MGVCWGCMLNLVEGRGWWKEGGLGGNEFNFFGFLRKTLSYILTSNFFWAGGGGGNDKTEYPLVFLT